MQQKTNLLLAMLLLLCLAGINSCKPKCDDTVPPKLVYGLNKDDSIYVPYKGHDTLTYQRTDTSGNIIDTVTLIGQGNEYKEVYIDHVALGCDDQDQYSKTCTIRFTDKSGIAHVKYNYAPQNSLTNFKVYFQDSIIFEYSDFNVDNRVNQGYLPELQVCGRYYCTINQIQRQYKQLTDGYIVVFDKNGLLIRFIAKHIIYNLIEQ